MWSMCAAVLLIEAAVQANGNLRRTTFVTFSGPVALPGVDLKAGTYVFELADPSQAKNIVRVLNERRTTVYLTAYTRTIRRPPGSPRTLIVSFLEAPRGAPLPINAWFPAGEDLGHKFIYGP